MHGVTTAIVAFIFAGVIWPHLIKHRVQFYAALLVVLFIIILDGIGHAFAGEGGRKAIYSIIALFQVAAIVLLVLSTGMSAKQLSGEVFHTIEVVRRGGEKETIIVPLSGQKPKPRDRDEPSGPARVDLDVDRDIEAEEAALDAAERGAAAAPVPSPPPPAAAKRPDQDRSIPLE